MHKRICIIIEFWRRNYVANYISSGNRCKLCQVLRRTCRLYATKIQNKIQLFFLLRFLFFFPKLLLSFFLFFFFSNDLRDFYKSKFFFFFFFGKEESRNWKGDGDTKWWCRASKPLSFFFLVQTNKQIFLPNFL